MRGEREKLKELISKKELELKGWEKSQKMRKQVLERTPRVWLDDHSVKKLPVILMNNLSRSQK